MQKKNFIKKYIAIFILVIILFTVATIIIKYYVEGEKDMPFQISKIMIISNAVGIQNEEIKDKWELNLAQNNDIYIDIIKNKNEKEEIIEKIIIDHFQIEEAPKKGEIHLYKPDSHNIRFKNIEEDKIQDKLEFTGAEASDLNQLKIANQGGVILFRYANENIATYKEEGTDSIKHDGTLLKKAGITNEEIKFKISFDVSIELKSEKRYKANITIQMPTGNITEEGTVNQQINGNEIVFKRY